MGLHWSAEKLRGWRDQYARMKRWHRRVQHGLAVKQRTATEEPEHLDDVLAFFLFCYTLRDWIAKTGGINSARIDELITASRPMKLCRDICNRTKHHNLSKPSIDADFSIGKECYQSKNGISHQWFIIADGDKLDLIALTHQCVAFWDSLITTGDLIEPANPFTLEQ